MGLGPRDADGQIFIHSAAQCEGGGVEGGRRDGARVVVTPWSYLDPTMKGLPTRMFHGWRWAAPMYNGMNLVMVFVYWGTRIGASN
jgi:hypothetical protein